MNRRQFLQSGAALLALPLEEPLIMNAQSNPQLTPASGLPPAGADGWVSLLNFHNLDGFYTMLEHSGKGVAEKKGMVTFENGLLHIMGNQVTDQPAEAGYIASYQEFENYRLRAEYKWGMKRFPPRVDGKRDSGVLYHLVGDDKVWPNCVECQIQEGDVCDYFLLGDTRAVPARGPIIGGPVRDGGPVANRKLRDQGGDFENRDGWNVVEIIVQGDRSTQILNGTTLNRLAGFQLVDPKNPGQFISLTRGKVAIEIELAEIWYRRFEIKFLA
jgi:hypothetical protein